MIAKEKKQAIIAEYGRTPNDTPKGSSLKKRNVKDDRSETWITCIP